MRDRQRNNSPWALSVSSTYRALSVQECTTSVNLPLVQMESNHRRYHGHKVLTKSSKQSQSALGVGSESCDQL